MTQTRTGRTRKQADQHAYLVAQVQGLEVYLVKHDGDPSKVDLVARIRRTIAKHEAALAALTA